MHRKAYTKAPFKNIAKNALAQMYLLVEEFKF